MNSENGLATYTYITTGATTQIFSGNGRLYRITINKTTTGAVKVIDNTTGTTANVATIAASTAPCTLHYGVSIGTGLMIINASTEDITVVSDKN